MACGETSSIINSDVCRTWGGDRDDGPKHLQSIATAMLAGERTLDSDTVVGKDDVAKLFDTFVSVGGSGQGGTGSGLPISLRAVGSGTLLVRGGGVGSVFSWLWLWHGLSWQHDGVCFV